MFLVGYKPKLLAATREKFSHSANIEQWMAYSFPCSSARKMSICSWVCFAHPELRRANRTPDIGSRKLHVIAVEDKLWQAGCSTSTNNQLSFGGFMNGNRKKHTHSSRFLSVLALVLGIVLLSAQLNAQQSAPPSQQQYPSQRSGQQQQPGQTPDPSAQPAPDSQAQSQQTGVQVFTGTIMKSGDKYVFQDSNGATYDIDAQEQVKQFEGKKVRVHGTLDPSTKMIHVQ